MIEPSLPIFYAAKVSHLLEQHEIYMLQNVRKKSRK